MKQILTLYLLLSSLLSFGQEVQLEDVDSFYPRMIRLSNGELLASFDVIGAGRIYKSTNDGVSWFQVATINETQYQNTCCSELYQVPQQLGGTTAGTLFWTVSAHNGGAPASRALKIYRSTDLGNTWSHFSTPVTGNTGLWEAEFHIDIHGRLVMSYATEEHKGAGYNQLIAHKISTDGGLTWGAEIIDIGMNDGIQRPGMPTVTRLPNGTFVMVYEICGPTYNCDAFYRTSSDGYSWGNASNTGVRIESTAGNHFSHAPTVTWIDNGTPNGELLVAGQVLRDGNNNNSPNNGSVYMVNSTNGNGLWAERVAPIFSPSDGTNPCSAYSTQFVSRSGGTEVVQLANRDCRVYSSYGPFNVPIGGGGASVSDGVYRLIAKHSGKALDVNGCSTADGANVQQWPWTGGDCQRWKIEHQGNGEYRITSQVSGKVLDVSGCGTANGANVHQWPWNGADCQRWYIESVGDGYHRLVSKQSGRVLDVDGCNTADGQNVQQWDWLGGDCQRWLLEPVSPNNIANGTYSITSKNSNKVLDVAGCSTAAGANVQQWPWNGANCQRWNILATNDGYFDVISVNSGMSLDVSGCSASGGANVQQWTSSGAGCQRWAFEEVETGFYRLISKNGGHVLDVNACSTDDGANVQMWQWLGGDCQRWSLNYLSAARTNELASELVGPSPTEFLLYPNPAKSAIHLQFSSDDEYQAKLKVFNTSGQVVLKQSLNINTGKNQIRIDTDELPKGIYLMSLKSRGKEKKQTFVIK